MHTIFNSRVAMVITHAKKNHLCELLPTPFFLPFFPRPSPSFHSHLSRQSFYPPSTRSFPALSPPYFHSIASSLCPTLDHSLLPIMLRLIIIFTRDASHIARSDTPNITWVVSRLSRSDTQHCCDARRPIARLRTRRSRAPPASVKCMCTRRVKSCGCVKNMNRQKYEKIHRFMRMRTRT